MFVMLVSALFVSDPLVCNVDVSIVSGPLVFNVGVNIVSDPLFCNVDVSIVCQVHRQVLLMSALCVSGP